MASGDEIIHESRRTSVATTADTARSDEAAYENPFKDGQDQLSRETSSEPRDENESFRDSFDEGRVPDENSRQLQEPQPQRMRNALRQYVHGQKGRELSRSYYLQDCETDDDGYEMGYTPRSHQGHCSMIGMQGASTFQNSSRQNPFRSGNPSDEQEGTFNASSDEVFQNYDMRPRGPTRSSRSPQPDPYSHHQRRPSRRNWQGNVGRRRNSSDSGRSIHEHEPQRVLEATQSSRAVAKNASQTILVGTLDSSPPGPIPQERYNHLLQLVAASQNEQRSAGSDGVRRESSPELRELMRKFSLRAPQESSLKLQSTPTDLRRPPSPFDCSSGAFPEREGDLKKVQQATRNLQSVIRDSEIYRSAPNTGRRNVLEPFQERIDKKSPLLPPSRSDDVVRGKLLSPFLERRDDKRRPSQPSEWSDESDTEQDRRFPVYPQRNPIWQGRPARFGLDDLPPSPENAHGPIPSSQRNSRSRFESSSQTRPNPSQSSGGTQRHSNFLSRLPQQAIGNGRSSFEGDDGFDTVVGRSAAAQPLGRPSRGSRSASFPRRPSSGLSDEPSQHQGSANTLGDSENAVDDGWEPRTDNMATETRRPQQ